MGTSTRFAVGVHLLTALAANPGKVLRSEDVADSANTNPVVVRRLFSLMTTAGLIRARLGPGGGFELARPASDITLRDVFDCVGERRALHRASVASERILPGRRPYPPCSAGGDSARDRGSAGRAVARYNCRFSWRGACPKSACAGRGNGILSSAARSSVRLRNWRGYATSIARRGRMLVGAF